MQHNYNQHEPEKKWYSGKLFKREIDMENPHGKIHSIYYLVVGYSALTFLLGSGFLFIYFVSTHQAPPFILTMVVYNTLWFYGMYAVVKYSYMRGLADSIEAFPERQETIV
ncbi:hypothetical protein [Alteromonas facilis]|uniref:hypothetical protein n=1 Tax=Alteromonas facilis TaxID=2048004 RepID=UPI000C289D69|nr:hypothetical protein [Alteromonas facilis]